MSGSLTGTCLVIKAGGLQKNMSSNPGLAIMTWDDSLNVYGAPFVVFKIRMATSMQYR